MKRIFMILFIVLLSATMQAQSFKAVCVGVNWDEGENCAADAVTMRNYLINKLGWDEDNVECETNGDATKIAIESAIESITDNQYNYCLYFHASHGWDNPRYILSGNLPSNNSISPYNLQSWFGSHQRYCIFIDACFSGDFILSLT